MGGDSPVRGAAGGKWQVALAAFFIFSLCWQKWHTQKGNHGKWGKWNVAANAITITKTRRDPKQSIVHQPETMEPEGQWVRETEAGGMTKSSSRAFYLGQWASRLPRETWVGGLARWKRSGENVARSQSKQFFAFRPALAISLWQENLHWRRRKIHSQSKLGSLNSGIVL